MADETVRLVLNVSGVQDIKALEKEMLDLAAAMGGVDAQFEQVNDSGKRAKKSLEELGAAGTGAAGDGKGGRGISGFAYAMQDLAQGGWPAILNNVQQLAAGIGLGAGVAGAAQLGAVALITFGNEMKKLLEPSGSLKDLQKELGTNFKANQQIVEDLGKKIEELGKKARKTAGDFAELAGKQADHKRMSEELAAQSDAETAAKAAEKAISPEAEANIKEMNDAGKATLRGKTFTDTASAMAAEAAAKAEEEIRKNRMGSEMERLQFWAKQNGIDTKGMDESQILAKGRERMTITDPETGRVVSEGTDDNVREAAKRSSVNNNDFQNARLAKAKAEAAAKSRELLGKVTGGAKSPEEWLEAFNQLPKPVQDMILSQQETGRNKEYEEKVGVAPAPGSTRGTSRQDFEKQLADAKASRKDIAETFDREEQDVKDAEARAKKKEADDRVADLAKKKALKEKEDAEKAEARRKENLDKFMQQEGLTPEGLMRQQQDAASRMPTAQLKQRAMMQVQQMQEAELRARMARRGMDGGEVNAGLRDIGARMRPNRGGQNMKSVSPEAEKAAEQTTQETARAGDQMVRAIVNNGQMTAKKFRQVEFTMNELSRMLAQTVGGQVGGPAWQGGRQKR